MTPNGSPDEPMRPSFASPYARESTVVAPRPSARLLADVADMQAVRPRVPWRSCLIVAVVGGVSPVWALCARPLRSGLADLSALWVVGVGALWLAGFIVPLALSILPGRGQVLPDGKRALRAAAVGAVLLMTVSLVLGVDALGGARCAAVPRLGEPLASWRVCVTAGLRTSAPVIAAGLFALRRVAITHAWRLGAAVGAAGGSLAGFTLHLGCSNGSPAHVALAHGGGVILGGVAGALSLFFMERTNR